MKIKTLIEVCEKAFGEQPNLYRLARLTGLSLFAVTQYRRANRNHNVPKL